MTEHVQTDSIIERRVQEIGCMILDEARHPSGSLWSGYARQQQWLTNILSDEKLRVQLLRFVDALPSLEHDADLVTHLEEYLSGLDIPLPIPSGSNITHWALRHAHRGLGSYVVSAVVRSLANRMARGFIAGADMPTVARTLTRLRKRRLALSLDLLGEATVNEIEAQSYQSHYLHMLEQISPLVQRWKDDPQLDTVSGRRSPRLNLSLKLSALYSQIDPADTEGCVLAISSRLRPILRRAKELGAFITVDMEQYETKAITIAVFEKVLMEDEFRNWPDVGIAIQAYLRDATDTIKHLVSWAKTRATPVTIRLVRGAYWDYETIIAQQNDWPIPVWTSKSETDQSYETCLQMLIDGYPFVETAAATHNVRSIALTIALAQSRGLKPDQYEMQMLYGMAEPLKEIIVQRGHRLRVYTPFGLLIPGMAYLVRRLLENTGSQSFLRMSFAEDLPAEKLLAPPALQNSGISAGNHQKQKDSFCNEPLRRFIDPSERKIFADAIERVRGEMGQHYSLLIGDRSVDSEKHTTSINPARPDEIVGNISEASTEHVKLAIAAATKAFSTWRQTPVTRRCEILRHAAASMRRRRDELAAWMIFEAGKTWREADGDVVEAIDFLEYYATEAITLERGFHFDFPGESNAYFYEPRGVGVIIAPWNFPLSIITGMTAAAIAVGNAAILKPAPQTPVIAAKLVEIFQEVGLPQGVINFLPGPDEVGAALVSDPQIHFVTFTGSQQVGCWINAEAAKVVAGQNHIKRIIAEMGGKNAIIVDADADLDDAIRGVVSSAFGYQGQKCSACSRLVVVGNSYEPLLERLAKTTQSLRVGLPEQPGTTIGPVIDHEAAERIKAAIVRGRNEARLVCELDVSQHGAGYYVAPTIFADVKPDSFLAQEEIFGPVLSVMHAKNFDDAIAMAMNSRYALTGGVYSRSPSHLQQAAREFRVGNLYLNRKITGAIVGRQPFGGMKMSGVGSKAGGPDYLRQFVEPRVVTENTLRRGFAPQDDV